MVQKKELIENTFNFIHLWFDWMKWLLIMGTITIIAQRTQDRIVLNIMYATYIILSVYMFLFIYIILSKILSKLKDLDNSAGKSTQIENKRMLYKKYSQIEDTLGLNKIISILYKFFGDLNVYTVIAKLVISILLASDLVYYWFNFLQDIALKFQ